jgi:mRNA-degrading endonuclease YafQ of YafQ-DinJ toxin-antitoxin module
VLIIGIAFYFKFSKKPVILFSEFEKQFLKKLLSKSGKQLDIDSLNYLLGLSKKSVEIQKKNRSEFLNKLDQKLRELLNTEDVLIIRVKDESDKRIFLYQLNEAFFDQINKLV